MGLAPPAAGQGKQRITWTVGTQGFYYCTLHPTLGLGSEKQSRGTNIWHST